MKKHNPRLLKYYNLGKCRRCNGFVALDANAYSLETYSKEVYCISCGDRWWVPYHSLGSVSEYQGARKPNQPPAFEPWEIAQQILTATIRKTYTKKGGAYGERGRRNMDSAD